MDKTKTLRLLSLFKKRVNKKFPVEEMIFFGSRAIGKHKKHSDIDLIIVSPKFTKYDFIKRGAKMYKFWDFGIPVDFLCYTPGEFERLKGQISIISHAIKHGISI